MMSECAESCMLGPHKLRRMRQRFSGLSRIQRFSVTVLIHTIKGLVVIATLMPFPQQCHDIREALNRQFTNRLLCPPNSRRRPVVVCRLLEV